ncbi:hypothetical protein ASF17_09990 [Frigoribacterium sp. Leaf263]|nr:hypothetical protein ASF17_09990 [Frigoribacterium sp. Leaf263]KQR65815.1 hypothetical protein ASF89_01090 [Frigoribacterium sp. Leaf172]
MPINEYVTTGAPLAEALRMRVTTAGCTLGAFARASRTHSGQCTPTAAGVWHCPQMVRPQRWQSTKLCRSGCR